MFKKPFTIAAIALASGATVLPTEASAGDPGLGALLGGAFGAAIGHGVNGRDGAVVGGVLGALAGASIAASNGPYYHGPAYALPPPVYYRPAPADYAPAPLVVRPAYRYSPPVAVVYPSRPVYVHAATSHRHGYDRGHRGNGGRDRQGR